MNGLSASLDNYASIVRACDAPSLIRLSIGCDRYSNSTRSASQWGNLSFLSNDEYSLNFAGKSSSEVTNAKWN